MNDNAKYSTVSGTSFATPMVAGVAALILSAHPEWTVGDVYHAITSTASQAETPDNSYGHGVVDAFSAITLNITGDYGCHTNCSDNGVCFQNRCKCYTHYYGLSCQLKKTLCEASCVNGDCDDNNVCICKSGWIGRSCGISGGLVLGAAAITFIVLISLCLCCSLIIFLCSSGYCVNRVHDTLKYRNPKLNLQMEESGEPMFTYNEVHEDIVEDIENQERKSLEMHKGVEPTNRVYSGYQGNFELGGDDDDDALVFNDK